MNPQNVRDLKSHTGIDTERPGSFQSRHIGPDAAARDQMLRGIGVPSLDALIDQTIPPDIRLQTPLDLPAADSEHGYLRRVRGVAGGNPKLRAFVPPGDDDART